MKLIPCDIEHVIATKTFNLPFVTTNKGWRELRQAGLIDDNLIAGWSYRYENRTHLVYVTAIDKEVDDAGRERIDFIC